VGTGEGADEEGVTSYDISIQPEAESEILEAYWYYEGREEGLGDEFREAVEACLDLIARHPRAYQVVQGEVRRGLLRRFPYALFYLVEGQRVVVFACFHASRDPREWQRRV